MKRWWSELILAAGLAALAGCGMVMSFKPGAGPDRMAADEHACGQAGDEGFVECMRNLGWYMSGGEIGSSPTPGAEATEPHAAAAGSTAAPTATSPPVAPASAPARAIVPSPAPAAKSTASVDAVPTVPSATVAAPVAAMPTASPTAAAEQGAVAAPAASDSLPRVRVGSWWKLGGSAAGLDSSIAACVTKLGAPHQPDPGAIIVTVALRDCLRADGWYAYDVSAAP